MNFFDWINLDKRESTKLSMQLLSQIRLAIFGFKLPEKTVLPSTETLMKELKISEEDVSLALEQLTKENLLSKNKKNQYVVSYQKQSNEFMAKAFLLYDYIRQLGLTPSIVTFEQKIILVDERISKKMNLPRGDKVVSLKRLYFGNNKPMVLLQSYLPLSLFPMLENISYTNQPHYEVIKAYHNIEPNQSVRHSRVIALGQEEAKYLSETVGAPCHQIEVWTYEKSGRLMDYNLATLPSSDVFETNTNPENIQPIL